MICSCRAVNAGTSDDSIDASSERRGGIVDTVWISGTSIIDGMVASSSYAHVRLALRDRRDVDPRPRVRRRDARLDEGHRVRAFLDPRIGRLGDLDAKL